MKRHMQDVRFYYGHTDPGSAMTEGRVGLRVQELDPTSVGDPAETRLAGIRQDTITYNGLFDDGADSLDKAKATLLGSGANVVSMFIGTATGDVAYCGKAHLFEAGEPLNVNGLVEQGATFQPNEEFDRCHVIVPKTSAAGSANTGSVDNGTISAAGGTLYLHVFSLAAGSNGSIILQDSATGTAWAAVSNMSLTVTGTTSTALGTTGTIRRYRRIVVGTGTGSVFQYAAALTPRAN